MQLCINDINEAIVQRYPDHLLYKILERKANALVILGKFRDALAHFEYAKQAILKSDLNKEKIAKWMKDVDDKKSRCEKVMKESPKEKGNCCVFCIGIFNNHHLYN